MYKILICIILVTCGTLNYIRIKTITRHRILEELLFDTIKIFKHYNVTYWIDSGTALGAYRDGGVIPHDCDVDLMVLGDFERAYNLLRMHLSVRHRAELFHIHTGSYTKWPSVPVQNKLMPSILPINIEVCEASDECANPEIDIYPMIIGGKYVWRQDCVELQTVELNKHSRKIYNNFNMAYSSCATPLITNHIFPLTPITFGNSGIGQKQVNAPKKLQKYLNHIYGDNLDTDHFKIVDGLYVKY